MDKFTIKGLMDYYLRTNSTGTAFRDLTQEDLASLAVLSIFDQKGQTVKTSSYSYERPDGFIDSSEFNVTREEYEKAVKNISKQIKKEIGADFTGVNIPSYDDMQAMLKGDNKISFSEINLFVRENIIREPGAEKPRPIVIP